MESVKRDLNCVFTYDIVKGGRGQGGQRKRWEDNIKEWTSLAFAKSQSSV